MHPPPRLPTFQLLLATTTPPLQSTYSPIHPPPPILLLLISFRITIGSVVDQILCGVQSDWWSWLVALSGVDSYWLHSGYVEGWEWKCCGGNIWGWSSDCLRVWPLNRRIQGEQPLEPLNYHLGTKWDSYSWLTVGNTLGDHLVCLDTHRWTTNTFLRSK